jgi:uncharacterized protein (DUF305 family)
MSKHRRGTVFAVGAVGVLAVSVLLGAGVHDARAQMDGNQHGTMGPHGQSGPGPQTPMGPHGQAGQENAGPGGGPAMSMDMARHFIEAMIPHHDDAVIMAELALTQAEHPELRALAADIKRVQTDEINLMRQWYQAWYGTSVPASAMGGAMPGMASHDPRAIDGAQPFDKAFIEEMIPHHQMAVMMATMAERGVTQPELRALLASIRTSQSAEIDLMRTWYEAWYGTPVPAAETMPAHGMDGGGHHGMSHDGRMGANGLRGIDSSAPQSSIRALSATEIQLIRSGEGAGLARAAAMNGLPGPRHVLDAADNLELTSEQAAQIQRIYESMHAAAVEVRAAYLNAQEAFEIELRSSQVTTQTLPGRLSDVDRQRTELARVHLQADLETAALLPREQRESVRSVTGMSVASH